MRAVEFDPRAGEEIYKAAQYYEEQAGLGDEFVAAVEKGVESIQLFPGAYAVVSGPYRRYLLKRFPYGIIYRYDAETILIIAVANLRRRPQYWLGRI